jgi:hypothetical protein
VAATLRRVRVDGAAMIKQTIVWTLLPDPTTPPAADGTIGLSLLASPRLTHGDVILLSEYPALADWPSVALQVAVEIAGPSGTVTVPAQLVDGPPDAALWRAVFPATLPVMPFVFDRAPAETPIVSFPVASIRTSLEQEYGRLLEPGVIRHSSGDGRFVQRDSSWEQVDRLISIVADRARTRAAADGVRFRRDVMPDTLSDDPVGWSRLADFHRPRQSVRQTGTSGLATRSASTERDFHAVFASLADHPLLQARLGLVRALRVRLPADLAGPVTIRAVPSHAAALVDYRPCTACFARAGNLRLAVSNGTEAPSYLPLDDISRYAPIDVDIDSTGLALQSYVSSLAAAPRDGPAPQVRPPLPRSDGIFVAEADRQIRFKDALVRAAGVLDADLSAGGDGSNVTLDAEDVHLGYRVDVFDVDSRRWYPLCRRVGAYRVVGVAAPLPIDDEGTVSDVITTADDDGLSINLLHQSLFRWNGWSLVVPPLGQMLDLNDQIANPEPTPDTELPFSMSVTVAPGTLPSLRYGRAYQFRARLVNIAGRSVPFDANPEVPTPATPALRHRRYEPVPSPVLVPRRPVTEGESAAVMVVRTDNSTLANPRPGPACERHLLAPKAAILTLERHGVLDMPGHHRLDPNVYQLLFDRDQRVIVGSADAGASNTPFIDADTVTLPWLPDPLSHGIAIHGLPGVPDLSLDWRQGSAWHERLPIRLIVQPGRNAGPAEAQIDPSGRAIRVVLEPGASLITTISSRLTEGDEETLGTWRWFADASGRNAADVDARRSDAAAGRIGQMTPPYEVRMVHAVRCPYEAPEFGLPRIERLPSEPTYELVDPAVGFHALSTASVHVEAEWSSLVDDPVNPEPIHVTGRAILERSDEDRLAAWGDTSTANAIPFRASVSLGDTRHRFVRFTPVAASRFASYFAQRRTVRLIGTQSVQLGSPIVSGTIVVTDRALPAPATYRLDRDVIVDHANGTIARRPEGALADGTEVDISFTPQPITRTGASVSLSVPASTRPAPPAVNSIVPAHAWRLERVGNTIMSTRRGGLLRVYLERPWLDSGDGELLAVIVADDQLRLASHPTWAQTLSFVSASGADPTGLGGGAPDLAKAAFPRAAASRIVRVPGLWDALPSEAANPLFRVKAVGHPVEFDTRKRLWFSDIEIGHEADQPFVLLKLARLQLDAVPLAGPRVLEDLHISQIVDAGFHQPTTDRTASVVLEGTTASVTVTGPAVTDLTSEITATARVGDAIERDPVMWEGLRQLPTTPLRPGPFVDGSMIRRWSGVVQLPATPGSQPMQLLLRESQVLPGGPQSRRLSYFDVLDL